MTDEFKQGLELFVIKIYFKDILHSSIKDMSILRWHLFSKHQFESEKLPPTLDTLEEEKNLRANYIV